MWIQSIVRGQAALTILVVANPSGKADYCLTKCKGIWQRGIAKVASMKINILKELISYNPETGELFWLHRAPWVSENGLMAERARKAFNTKIAGGMCLTSVDKDGYLCGQIMGKFYRAHRVAYAIHNGHWPKETVDHENRVRTDNRAANLRAATRSEQQQNRSVQKNSETGIPGVHWSKSHGRWMARKTVNGKRVYLGTFYRTEDAARAIRNYV